jgi:ketol-acid reductoisomerase
MYVEGKGVPSLITVFREASGKAKQHALAYAKGNGATRAGVLKTTFQEETEIGLCSEKAVLCGGSLL